MKLKPEEHDLIGSWRMQRDRVVADPIATRIQWLIGEHLLHLGTDASGWDELYRDPEDGRLWELTLPQSEMHGGGPPRLTCLSIDEARRKYGAVAER